MCSAVFLTYALKNGDIFIGTALRLIVSQMSKDAKVSTPPNAATVVASIGEMCLFIATNTDLPVGFGTLWITRIAMQEYNLLSDKSTIPSEFREILDSIVEHASKNDGKIESDDTDCTIWCLAIYDVWIKKSGSSANNKSNNTTAAAATLNPTAHTK